MYASIRDQLVSEMVPGRLTVWPVHAIPVNGSIDPDSDNELAALDVRAERPPADAAMALGTQADGSSRQRSSPCSVGFSTVSEVRHNPLPHIAPLTTALKSAYKNTAFPSTRTSSQLREFLIRGGLE